MDTQHFSVSFSADPTRARSPWKLEVRASFAGRKIRRFFASEGEAWLAGENVVAVIRAKGVEGLMAQERGMSMKAAVAAFSRRQEGKSKSHRDKVRQIGGLLAARFTLVDVSPAQLDAWFAEVQGSPTTRAMVGRYARMFFRWAHRMGFTARDVSAALDLPRAAVGRNILAPPMIARLLAVEGPDWLRAVLVLGAFAGLRTEEMLRMCWGDVDAATGEIHVRPGVMKDSGGFFERIVDFTPPLDRRREWLAGLAVDREAPLVPLKARHFHRLRGDWAQAAGLEVWPDNCLRHSFATYHLAISRDPGKTAHQMGHSSPAMVRRVYAVPARKVDAAAWWGV